MEILFLRAGLGQVRGILDMDGYFSPENLVNGARKQRARLIGKIFFPSKDYKNNNILKEPLLTKSNSKRISFYENLYKNHYKTDRHPTSDELFDFLYEKSFIERAEEDCFSSLLKEINNSSEEVKCKPINVVHNVSIPLEGRDIVEEKPIYYVPGIYTPLKQSEVISFEQEKELEKALSNFLRPLKSDEELYREHIMSYIDFCLGKPEFVNSLK